MSLLSVGDTGGGYERCVGCGRLAVGPCARCHAPLCGDCCVLTEGGTKPYAVCRSCARVTGPGLQRAWWTVLTWFAWPVLALVLALIVLHLLFPGR
jgi:hypothetical protein